MLLGVALGAAFPNVGKADWMAALANVFLRLIKSIIAPLIFGTLVYGIAGTGSVKTMGRIGLKAIVYFEVLTTIALFLGLGAVNLVRPGEGMTLERIRRRDRPAAGRLRRFPARSNTPFPPASSMPWRAAMCCRLSCFRFCSARRARPSGRKRRLWSRFANRSPR